MFTRLPQLLSCRSSRSSIRSSLLIRCCSLSSTMSSLPPLSLASDLDSFLRDANSADGVVLVADEAAHLSQETQMASKVVSAMAAVDKSLDCFVSPLNSSKLVFSSTGPVQRDFDDVRCFAQAAEKGVARAIKSGCRKPVLAVSQTLTNTNDENDAKFQHANLVAALGALKALYVPLEMRESVAARANKVDALAFLKTPKFDQKTISLAKALEEARIVSRDIGGSDPERMAAPKVAEYVEKVFKDSGVKVEVLKGQSLFEKEYPCFAAVNRAASVVPRHDGRVIWLTYEPEGPVKRTIMIVGKGVTYDTGGLDIKAGGIMAGMSRDKIGSANVAALLKAVSILKPKDTKVVGAMAMVRNSVGAEGYVADEIITARSGIRIRVGNTDAEGRMAMVDVLCHMKEKALKEVNPHLMTIATLTGHEVLAYGPYGAVMDNGPARKEGFAQRLIQIGDLLGDPFELSTMRKEDFGFIKDKSGEFVDILQCNNAASSRTPRGHQFPGAFLHTVSGLDDHMLRSKHPLKYSHLDIAGMSGELPHPTTAGSVVALTAYAMESSQPIA